MVDIPLYQVDAFAAAPMQGNPAAVSPLAEWLDDGAMQAIAAENNLSETVFFVGGGGNFQIRWFTPKMEVELCGHGTIAAAWVIFNILEPGLDTVTFASKSGPLKVGAGEGGKLTMDFPAWRPVAARKSFIVRLPEAIARYSAALVELIPPISTMHLSP